MLAVEVKGRNTKFTWEMTEMYKNSKRGHARCRKISSPNWLYRKSTKNIIGGDLNLPYAHWNGNSGGNNGTQALINSLVWENGYSQVTDSPTRVDALLDVYLVRPESSVTSSSVEQGISDHSEVILEVDWVENYREPQVERVVPMYKKTDVLGLQTFLSEKFPEWAISGRSVEEIWNNFKNIVCESLERCVPYRILRKNSDPENYNKEIKRLK